jgi:hypothetical protein
MHGEREFPPGFRSSGWRSKSNGCASSSARGGDILAGVPGIPIGTSRGSKKRRHERVGRWWPTDVRCVDPGRNWSLAASESGSSGPVVGWHMVGWHMVGWRKTRSVMRFRTKTIGSWGQGKKKVPCRPGWFCTSTQLRSSRCTTRASSCRGTPRNQRRMRSAGGDSHKLHKKRSVGYRRRGDGNGMDDSMVVTAVAPLARF